MVSSGQWQDGEVDKGKSYAELWVSSIVDDEDGDGGGGGDNGDGDDGGDDDYDDDDDGQRQNVEPSSGRFPLSSPAKSKYCLGRSIGRFLHYSKLHIYYIPFMIIDKISAIKCKYIFLHL